MGSKADTTLQSSTKDFERDVGFSLYVRRKKVKFMESEERKG